MQTPQCRNQPSNLPARPLPTLPPPMLVAATCGPMCPTSLPPFFSYWQPPPSDNFPPPYGSGGVASHTSQPLPTSSWAHIASQAHQRPSLQFYIDPFRDGSSEPEVIPELSLLSPTARGKPVPGKNEVSIQRKKESGPGGVQVGAERTVGVMKPLEFWRLAPVLRFPVVSIHLSGLHLVLFGFLSPCQYALL